MDLIESPRITPPIILLQTVVEEVRHRSSAHLPRSTPQSRQKIRTGALQSDCTHPARQSRLLKLILFLSVQYSETAIVREEDETPNDRNNRVRLRLEAKALQLDETKKAPAKERQPTGCVVGVLEQNGPLGLISVWFRGDIPGHFAETCKTTGVLLCPLIVLSDIPEALRRSATQVQTTSLQSIVFACGM
ncbi:hypothetical protein HYDPIDRAFT_190813 [Hydnomerulius pinastri MD-312]|uniref:Unplaced genomic scaffold scaffold_111, whole genome shotgun sequence n=1 Tax=Hydnomerulius pinastri MD-312 TaxID=994086 RepID=A0A0C9VLB2_9AGAM|nr:hypothetical protein HYDPIDRAFT_190813 [Hydnomerulius pinastri MD-312]